MPEIVDLPHPGVTLEFGEPGSPVVVLVHDDHGRLPWLDQYALALARAGFHVLVPDLYDGRATLDDGLAEGLAAQLDVGFALGTIRDGIDSARARGSQRVGLVGFAPGGWLALLEAQDGGADAVVAYCASLGPQEHGVIPCAVLLHLAEHDDWIDDQRPEAFIGRLREHGTPVTSHTYPGTYPVFPNASLRDRVDPDAAALAYRRTEAFLREHLGDAS